MAYSNKFNSVLLATGNKSEAAMGYCTLYGDTCGALAPIRNLLDGAVYNVVRNIRIQQPSIDGTKTFVQYFSIRQTPRQSGTISVTEHFKQWERMGLPLVNLYEAKFLVEAGGGTGWLEFSYLKLAMEDR